MAFLKQKKRKEDSDMAVPFPSAPPAPGSPLEQIMMMQEQGYSNPQIVQTLQGMGFSSQQIYDAMNHASLSANAPQAQNPFEVPQQEQGYQPSFAPSPPAQPFQSYSQKEPAIDDERIQEVAEAIIEEKWDTLIKDIKKVAEWKERTDERISKIEQQLIDMRMGIDSLTKSMMSRISAYDQNIVDVGTEIKAMEKVFQKVLPSLTENVNKLDRMTKGYNEPAPQPVKRPGQTPQM